jgi:hypothetical protein
MAASVAAQEAVFLGEFLNELDKRDDVPVELAVDNTGARDLAYNPEHHSKSKHIERRHFFVREMVENMRLRIPYVNTVYNLADFFTKPLPARVFIQMRDTIMNVPPELSPPTTDRVHEGVLNSKVMAPAVRGG